MQHIHSGRRGRGVAGALVVIGGLLLVAGPAGAQDVEPEPRGRSVVSSVLHVVGGAVIGGWLGWMGSQVVLSDWDRSASGELMDRRAGWVLGGAVTGVIASQLLGTTSPPGAARGLTPRSVRDRSVITREEIALSGANNAYELIQSLRGEWLRAQRGTNRWAESARGEVTRESANLTPGEPRIIVYMNSTRLGGLETLREISLFELQRVEFVGPQEAVTRYGTGHTHGVIQLSTGVDGATP